MKNVLAALFIFLMAFAATAQQTEPVKKAEPSKKIRMEKKDTKPQQKAQHQGEHKKAEAKMAN